MTTLLDCLTQQAARVAQFLDCLKAEEEILSGNLIEQLSALTEKKLQFIQEINQADTACQEVLAQLPRPNAATTEWTVRGWVDAHPAEASVRAAWQALLELTEKAKQQHRINQLLLDMHMGRTESALQALQAAQRSAQLYGSNGKTTHTGQSRVIDAA